jgi:predicted nucleic acid-binding protein
MIIVDSSVLLKFVVPEIRSDLAMNLLGEELAAPSVWMAEAANALSRKVRLKEFGADTAARLMRQLLKAPVKTFTIEELITSALDLSTALSHPVYDCLFLALAIREDSFVITDDIGFAKVVRRNTALASRTKLLSEL